MLVGEHFQLAVYFHVGTFVLAFIDLCQPSPHQGTMIADDEPSSNLLHVVSFPTLDHSGVLGNLGAISCTCYRLMFAQSVPVWEILSEVF